MFAPEYPDVNFIIAHLGSFTDDWKAHQQVTYQLARYPNVYADTSGVRQFRYLVEAIQRAGPHKLLFGSDGPWLHPGLELYKIRLLGLPAEEEELVLGGNILRLLRTVRSSRNAQMKDRRKQAIERNTADLRDYENPLPDFKVQRDQVSDEAEYKL
jgi:hypothetical protein